MVRTWRLVCLRPAVIERHRRAANDDARQALPWPRAYLTVDTFARRSCRVVPVPLERAIALRSTHLIRSFLLSPTVRRDRASECDMTATENISSLFSRD